MSEQRTFLNPATMTPEQKRGLLDYWELQRDFSEELNEKVIEVCLKIPEFVPIIKAMPKEMLEKNRTESLERSRRAFELGEWEPYFKHLETEGQHYARMGLTFGPWVELIRLYKDVLQPYMVKRFEKDQARLLAAITAMNELLYVSV